MAAGVGGDDGAGADEAGDEVSPEDEAAAGAVEVPCEAEFEEKVLAVFAASPVVVDSPAWAVAP